MATIYTVGHSNKSIDEFAALLVGAGIEIIVDVRTSPWSRYNPQFNQRDIATSLDKAGIRYIFKGKNLGGKGLNVKFDETLDEIVAHAEAGDRVALMCSEGSHVKCHRNEMLTAPLLERGATVGHLQWSGEIVTVTPAAPGVIPPVSLFDLPESEHVRRAKPGFIAP